MKNIKNILFILGVMNITHAMELPKEPIKKAETVTLDKYESCPICQTRAREVDKGALAVTSCCKKFICQPCKKDIDENFSNFQKKMKDPEWRREYGSSTDFPGWPTKERSGADCPLCRAELRDLHPATINNPKIAFVIQKSVECDADSLTNSGVLADMLHECNITQGVFEVQAHQNVSPLLLDLMQEADEVKNKCSTVAALKRSIVEKTAQNPKRKLYKLVKAADCYGVTIVYDEALKVLAQVLNKRSSVVEFLEKKEENGAMAQKFTHGLTLPTHINDKLAGLMVNKILFESAARKFCPADIKAEDFLIVEQRHIGPDQATILNEHNTLDKDSAIEVLKADRFTSSGIITGLVQARLVELLGSFDAREKYFKTKTLGCDGLPARFWTPISRGILQGQSSILEDLQKKNVQTIHPEAAVLLKFLIICRNVMKRTVRPISVLKEIEESGYLNKDRPNRPLVDIGEAQIYVKPNWNPGVIELVNDYHNQLKTAAHNSLGSFGAVLPPLGGLLLMTSNYAYLAGERVIEEMKK